MLRKYFKYIFPIILIMGVLPFVFIKRDKDTLSLLEEKDMLAYTIDGVSVGSGNMPAKGSGYVVSSITCKNGSKLVWDNDNWELEMVTLEDFDSCVIDFTTDKTKSSTMVTLTSTESLVDKVDSTSKTPTVQTPVNFYVTEGYVVTEISSCNFALNDDQILVNSTSSRQDCNTNIKRVYTLAEAILRDNPTVSERTSFNAIFTTNSEGKIYKTNKTEDGSDVYYYAGATTKNWVKFGNFYWRIIRTNEDGSVRIIYVGSSLTNTSGTHSIKYSSSQSNIMYVGYMYGTSGSLSNNRLNTISSTAKINLDSWYLTNLYDNYGKYVSKTAIYCNDRSIGSGSYSSTAYFGANTRLDTNKTPSYKCGANTSNGLFESTQAVEDKFSSSTEGGGNGQLKCNSDKTKDCPIAMMTADEVVFAGGYWNTENTTAWYNKNTSYTFSDWYLMSPSYYQTNNGAMYSVTLSRFGGMSLTYTASLRPVISIDKCAYVNGSGTSTDPYVIDETLSTC